MGDRIVSSTNGAGTMAIQCRRMKLDPYLPPYTEMNSEWMVDLSVKTKSIKLLEEKTGINLCDLGLGKAFLDKIPKVHKTKEKIDDQN